MEGSMLPIDYTGISTRWTQKDILIARVSMEGTRLNHAAQWGYREAGGAERAHCRVASQRLQITPASKIFHRQPSCNDDAESTLYKKG